VNVRASDPKRALSIKVKVDLLVCTVCVVVCSVNVYNVTGVSVCMYVM